MNEFLGIAFYVVLGLCLVGAYALGRKDKKLNEKSDVILKDDIKAEVEMYREEML